MLLPWTCQSKKTQKCEQKMLDNFALKNERNTCFEMFDICFGSKKSKKCSMDLLTFLAMFLKYVPAQRNVQWRCALVLQLSLWISRLPSFAPREKRHKTLCVVFNRHLKFHLCIFIFDVFFLYLYLYLHASICFCIASYLEVILCEWKMFSPVFFPKHNKISLKERSH